MLNKVMIIGRLGRDPELRYTQSGSPVATLNVATDESYMDRDGNKVERTEWHRVSVFQRQAENCANFLTKGSLVYVEGSLQTRKWQDQNGQDRYTTEIKAQRVQFLDRRSDGPRADMGGYEDDYGAPAPAPRAPPRRQHGRRPAPGPAPSRAPAARRRSGSRLPLRSFQHGRSALLGTDAASEAYGRAFLTGSALLFCVRRPPGPNSPCSPFFCRDPLQAAFPEDAGQAGQTAMAKY